MKNLSATLLLLALVLPVQGAYVVRISDLQCSPTPPNPIKVAGRVVSESPLKLSDGNGEITVVGTTALLSDFLVATGDWDGSVLTVSGDVTTYVGRAATEMIYIPAGSFLMGNNGSEPYWPPDEFPQHEVYLSGYWIGKYEVTRGEYRRFMQATGRAAPQYWDAYQDWSAPYDDGNGFTQTDDHPVVGVTWYDAEAYCAWAGGHLPTEAQWEKAARWTGSYPNVYPWGNVWDWDKCNNYWDHNSAGGGYTASQTAPVGSYPSGASPYALQDMAGNVWEWCADWYSSSYYSESPSTDPQGPTSGSYRVLRGGGWGYVVSNFRCAFRVNDVPDGVWGGSGFRFSR